MKKLTDAERDDATDRLFFETTGMSSDDAFEHYRTFYGIGADIRRTGPDVRAWLEAWRLDRMLLYHRRLNDVGHRRDVRRTQADGFTQFTVTLLLDGEVEVDGDDGSSVCLRPGEMLLLDTNTPFGNRMRHAHLVTLSVARERLTTAVGHVGKLHGLVLTAEEARLFRDFVESLLRNLPTMSRTATTAAAGVLMAILSIVINKSGTERLGKAPPRDMERLLHIKRLIDARAADAAFTTVDAIRESGLSRATVYRLVEPEGGLATLIRNRRLEGIRQRLDDPTETRAFADLVDAAGLASVSHASRAFVERYGIRPNDYRGMVGAGADALKLSLWQEEVH